MKILDIWRTIDDKEAPMPGTRTLQQKNKAPFDRTSAFDLAVMGKYRASGSKETIKFEMDAQDEDWKQLIRKAKQNGPGSWMASKVDFTYNSARFVGKVGYPVRGEVIPLFDGAAMDVSDAEMRSEKPEKAEPDPRMAVPTAYKNWVVGSDGLLVLAPAHADNVVPVRTGKFVVTENSISATAVKDLEFRQGELTVRASRMDLSNQTVILYGIQVREGDKDKTEKYQEIAAISEKGLSLFPAPVPIQEMPEHEPNILEKAGEAAEHLIQTYAPEGEIAEGINVREGNFLAETEKELVTNAEEAEDPLWTQILNAVKNESKTRAKEALMHLVERDTAAAAQVFVEKWEQIKAVYDGFSDEDLRESWVNMPAVIQDIFIGKITGEEEIKTYVKKLIPADELAVFLGMEGEKEEKVDEKKSAPGAEIPLAAISLFPGLADFKIFLKPAYTFSAYVKPGAQNVYALWNTRADEATQLNLTAGIKGSLSLRAVAELEVGIPFILKGFANLYAEAGLTGSLLEGETEGSILEAQVNFPIKRRRDGSFAQQGALEGRLEGGLELYGTVGTEGGVRSSILMWEKTLIEKEFGRWNLGAIHALLKVRKEPADGMFSGWSLDEAYLAVSGPQTGFGAAFQEKNTPTNKYGLYDPQIKESVRYAQIHDDFMQALKMLKRFADNDETDKTMILSTNAGEGVNQVLDIAEEIRGQFVVLWAEGLQEQQQVLFSLDELEKSGKYQKKLNETENNIKKHEERMAKLEGMDESAEGNVYEAYASFNDGGKIHHAGRGYRHAMKRQARETATGFSQIVAYERNRYQEKIKSHQEAIALVERLQKGEHGNPPLSDGEILAKYKDKAGDQIEKHKAMFQNTQAIIRYEEEQIQKKRGEKNSPDSRYQSLEKLKAETPDPQAFISAYLDRISDMEASVYGNPALLLEYEKLAMGKKTDLAAEFDQIQEKMDKIEAKSMTSQEAVAEFQQMKMKKNAKKAPELAEIFGSDLYRTASIEDLIEIELGSSYTALRDYLAREALNPQGTDSSRANKDKLKEILGKEGAKTAQMQFEAYVRGLEQEQVIPNMTIDMLWDYVRRTKKVNAQEYSYVSAGRVRVQQLSKDPGKAREAELETIRQYFKVFSSTKILGCYKEQLLSGEETDLSMLMNALESGAGKNEEEQSRIARLQEAKEADEPAYLVLTEYLSSGGNKKTIQEHQKKKAEQGLLNMEDVFRFYETELYDKTDSHGLRNFGAKKTRGMVQKKSAHYERYERIKALLGNGASYEEMLEVYKSFGGGNNYGKYIKEKIRAGTLDGFTIEGIMAAEGEKRDRDNLDVNRRNARIALVRRMEGEGKDYQEILEAYEAQARTDKGGIVGKVKSGVNARTGFEKHQEGAVIKAEDILTYERIAMAKDGESHARRLRGLLGLPVDSDEFLTAPLPTDDAVRAQRREDYLRENKRFRESREVKAAAEEELQALLNRPAREQKESILAYERERKDEYQGQMDELLQQKQRLEDMNQHLELMERICHSVTFNLEHIRQNPGNLWNEIDLFHQNVESIRLEKEKEEANQKERTEIRTRLEQLKKEDNTP